MRRWVVRGAAALVVLLVVLSAVVAGSLTEAALHPIRLRRASDTAALAQSAASAVAGMARQVQITARDGVILKAWWIQPKDWTSGRAVLACHGVADSGFGVMGAALLFARNGYAVLVPDGRGHGESGGFVTYGVYEAADTAQWVAWLRTQPQRATRVFGFGESLGGAVLLQSLGAGVPFEAVIAESAYGSFAQVARERIHRSGRVPMWVAAALVTEGLLYARIAHGVWLWQAQPAEAVRNSRVPILLIHGAEDHETSPVHSEMILRNARNAELWRVPKAGHTGAYGTAPQAFEARVLGWFDRYGRE